MELRTAGMSLWTLAELRTPNLGTSAEAVPVRTHHPRSHGETTCTVALASELPRAETTMVPAQRCHPAHGDIAGKRAASAVHAHRSAVSTVVTPTSKVASVAMSAPSPGGVAAMVATMMTAHLMAAVMSMMTAPCHPLVTETVSHVTVAAMTCHGIAAHRTRTLSAAH